MKKNRSKKKPRTPFIHVAFDREVSIEMSPPSPDGKMHFIDTATGERILPSAITTSQTYERKKGPKVVFQAEQKPSDINLDPNENLSSFGMIFAIDTNTNPTTNISTSVSLQIHSIGKNEAGAWRFSSRFPPAFIFNSGGKDPEKFGWHNLVLRLIPSADVIYPVAIIVDSHLNEINAINAQMQPLNEDFILPAGFKLLYGSADTGGEFIANVAIRTCDAMATKIASEGQSFVEAKGFRYFPIPQFLIMRG
jgi:hypothetical protein